MSNEKIMPVIQEGYTGHSELAPTEGVLFANGSMVSVDGSESLDWRVGDSVVVGGEVNVKVTSPDGLTTRLVPQHELFQTHLSHGPEELERLLAQRQAERERLRQEAGVAGEAGELSTKAVAEVTNLELDGEQEEKRSEDAAAAENHETADETQEESGTGDKAQGTKTNKKYPSASTASLDRMRLIEHEPVMGPVGGGGAPLDLVNRVRLAHLRMETVQKALSLGIEDPIDYLLKARTSPEMVKRLQQRGWDMSPPPENETPVPRDPVVIEGERGDRSRKQVNEIIRMIESPEGRSQLLDELRRPGELPMGLHNIPYLGRRAGRRLLAWRIYRRERSRRPKTKQYTMTDGSKETRDIIYNDGRFGRGFTKVREILDGLESLDRNIKVDRSKLSPMNLHELMGDLLTPRRNLAQQIDRDIRSLIKLRVLKTERLGFYEHAPFKARLKEYEDHKDPRVIAEERNEFVNLRFLEVRDAKQQARFEELLSKHRNWE